MTVKKRKAQLIYVVCNEKRKPLTAEKQGFKHRILYAYTKQPKYDGIFNTSVTFKEVL